MGRKTKVFLLIIFGVVGTALAFPSEQSRTRQTAGSVYQNNNCVNCHAQLTEPLHASIKHIEWQLSAHQAKGVGCEKCHGGDPAVNDKKKAHADVLPSLDAKSRLNVQNQPETCGSCHENVISAFRQSAHYKHLKGLGLGPACSSCHPHMATRVIRDSQETSTLCARCHNSFDIMQPRPDIPVRARETMMALQRADWMIQWARILLSNGQTRGWMLDAEQHDLKLSEVALKDAQVNWHSFNFESIRKQADDSFMKSTKVKEAMRKKLLSE